ncbi:hypothetical protein ABZ799_26675 [Nocardiopsis dassonvillei]|uniref:hypothetical protein n=1 Tax=Nocardiopsis dassonvillei TaxID=2014 RepID=UPI0033C3D126
MTEKEETGVDLRGMTPQILMRTYTEDTYGPFWERAAEDLGTGTSYITGKIAIHLKLSD